MDSNKKFYNDIPQVRPQQYFDMDLVSGISESCKVNALSLPPVASYPKSGCLFFRRRRDKVTKNLNIDYISLINLPIIKTIIIMINVFIKTLFHALKNRNEDRIVLCGYISFETSIPALIAAKITKTKVYTIVPDVPLYSSSYTKSYGAWGQKIKSNIVSLNSKIESSFEGYVFLTQEMNNLINRNNKPYIVIEGMIKKDNFIISESINKYSPRIIMYAGTLHEKFGIKKLVESFTHANLTDCELWIYGSGDYEDKIKKITSENEKIKYKGNVSKLEILELERKATLLVNPRPTYEEFTKYSFPSKTLEYMASATPLLTTKLAGIPKDYDDYLYYFKGESIQEMADKIKEVMGYSSDKLDDLGSSAMEFVLENKNNITQTKKIFEFINSNI